MQEIFDNENNKIAEDEYEIFRVNKNIDTIQRVEKIVARYKKIIKVLSFPFAFFVLFFVVTFCIENSNNNNDTKKLDEIKYNNISIQRNEIKETNDNISKNKDYNDIFNETKINKRSFQYINNSSYKKNDTIKYNESVIKNNETKEINNNSNYANYNYTYNSTLNKNKFNTTIQNEEKKSINYNNNNSFFLNTSNNSLEIKNNIKTAKKKIYVKYINFSPFLELNKFDIHNILLEKYDVIISNKPDYLIFGQFLGINRYYNSVKLFITTKNKIPNFNKTDYSIGISNIENIENGDRYFRKPIRTDKLSAIYSIYNQTKKIGINNTNKNFCAMFTSKSEGRVQNDFYQRLSKYKTVDSGCSKDKIEFLKHYKFSICFENSKNLGYITEKLFDSFEAGTIPIYYGDDSILELLNNKSYIHIKNESEFDEKIELIKKIDQNDTLYEQMIKEKIVIDDSRYQKEYQKYKDFIYHIFDQDKEKAKRYIRINNQ